MKLGIFGVLKVRNHISGVHLKLLLGFFFIFARCRLNKKVDDFHDSITITVFTRIKTAVSIKF